MSMQRMHCETDTGPATVYGHSAKVPVDDPIKLFSLKSTLGGEANGRTQEGLTWADQPHLP